MRCLWRQLLLVYLAVWMPICCCQTRALAQAIVQPSTAPGDAGAVAVCCDAQLPACCRARLQERPAQDPAPAATAGCCDKGTAPASHGKCCTTCKDRAAAPAAASLEVDSSTQVNALATLMLACDFAASPACAVVATGRYDTGPPPRPAGRDALAHHSILVI